MTQITDGGKIVERRLDRSQLGHIRHIANLLRQPPGDWSGMHGRGPHQGDFGSYRYQLAYMTYALGLAHRHRLPAAPGLFKPLFEKAIGKMLSPDVWMYWKDTSLGGAAFNAHISYQQEWDPVARDNIMYSAYVQSMALMYTYLFNDERYREPGSLTFSFYTPLWGGDEHRFEYSQDTLNEHIYWLMVESGFLGVACEPNCIFQICQQPAILGFRLSDMINGTNVADDVTRNYETAWRDFGRLDETGHFHALLLNDSKQLVPNTVGSATADAWVGALMNTWNSGFVRSNYRHQVQDYLEYGPDGTISVRIAEKFPPDLPGLPSVPQDDTDFGWTAVWASEMGDLPTLTGLLAHADRYMNPTWRDGGLFYPRNDQFRNHDGHRTEMSPIVGNALLAYARLNVEDGLRQLYNDPLPRDVHGQPALTMVAPDIDISLAYYDADRRELQFAANRNLQARDASGTADIEIANVDSTSPQWTLSAHGQVVGSSDSATAPTTRLGVLRRAAQPGVYQLNLPDEGVVTYTLRFGAGD